MTPTKTVGRCRCAKTEPTPCPRAPRLSDGVARVASRGGGRARRRRGRRRALRGVAPFLPRRFAARSERPRARGVGADVVRVQPSSEWTSRAPVVFLALLVEAPRTRPSRGTSARASSPPNTSATTRGASPGSPSPSAWRATRARRDSASPSTSTASPARSTRCTATPSPNAASPSRCTASPTTTTRTTSTSPRTRTRPPSAARSRRRHASTTSPTWARRRSDSTNSSREFARGGRSGERGSRHRYAIAPARARAETRPMHPEDAPPRPTPPSRSSPPSPRDGPARLSRRRTIRRRFSSALLAPEDTPRTRGVPPAPSTRVCVDGPGTGSSPCTPRSSRRRTSRRRYDPSRERRRRRRCARAPPGFVARIPTMHVPVAALAAAAPPKRTKDRTRVSLFRGFCLARTCRGASNSSRERATRRTRVAGWLDVTPRTLEPRGARRDARKSRGVSVRVRARHRRFRRRALDPAAGDTPPVATLERGRFDRATHRSAAVAGDESSRALGGRRRAAAEEGNDETVKAEGNGRDGEGRGRRRDGEGRDEPPRRSTFEGGRRRGGDWRNVRRTRRRTSTADDASSDESSESDEDGTETRRPAEKTAKTPPSKTAKTPPSKTPPSNAAVKTPPSRHEKRRTRIRIRRIRRDGEREPKSSTRPLELVHADGRGATEPRAVPSRRRRLEDDGGLGA